MAASRCAAVPVDVAVVAVLLVLLVHVQILRSKTQRTVGIHAVAVVLVAHVRDVVLHLTATDVTALGNAVPAAGPVLVLLLVPTTVAVLAAAGLMLVEVKHSNAVKTVRL